MLYLLLQKCCLPVVAHTIDRSKKNIKRDQFTSSLVAYELNTLSNVKLCDSMNFVRSTFYLKIGKYINKAYFNSSTASD